MSIRLFNTLSAKVEEFQPLNRDRVTMYVCGPTVYNRIHVGNARPLVIFDTLYRLLRHDYPRVVYTRNITDIDDKIINAARENKTTCGDIAQKYIRAFHEDAKALNTLPPDIEPRATDHISGMLAMIQTLINNHCAYEAEDHVLFDTQAYDKFGILSKRKREDLIAGARVEVAPYKKDPADFVLWKPSSDDQPGWDSPWGYGRPGWHLECSVMAAAHLGEEIDIHGGGQDLIFPHHENEMSQSSCAHNGKMLARYWVHNGYVLADGGKMAKSAGNFFTVDDALRQFPGETIRYVLLKTHYRKPLDWSEDALKDAHDNMSRLYEALGDISHNNNDANRGASDSTGNIPPPHDDVLNALRNNLNTVEAIRVIHQLARKKQSAVLYSSCDMLGLLQNTPDAWFKWCGANASSQWSNEKIDDHIKRRQTARINGDYEQADAIREQLEKAGVLLEDSGDTTEWKRKV